MHSDPPDRVELLAEMLWWRYFEKVHRDDWYPALRNVIDDRVDLEMFLEEQIQEYEEQEQFGTWSEFKLLMLQRNISETDDIDWDEILDHCREEYYNVRYMKYD